MVKKKRKLNTMELMHNDLEDINRKFYYHRKKKR